MEMKITALSAGTYNCSKTADISESQTSYHFFVQDSELRGLFRVQQDLQLFFKHPLKNCFEVSLIPKETQTTNSKTLPVTQAEYQSEEMESKGWLKLAESSFNFWDNDLDADYDKM